jgi:hypothetical protein
VEFSVWSAGSRVDAVSTASTDDFYYFRDSVHAALEDGEFGSRFPLFMRRFEPDEWRAEEVAALQGELEAIAEAFRRLPPVPLDAHWESRAAASGTACESLYDVFVDAGGHPLLGRLIELCRAARRVKAPIVIG